MLHHGHSPLRLSATVLLWPLFPIRPRFEISSDKNGPHFTPPRQLPIGLTYDHKLRVGPFEGANALGLLTNLSALRLVGVKALGPLELALSLGALVDPLRHYATAEASVQLGLYLPFFNALKVSVEALGHGVPSFVQPDLIATLGGTPLRRQGILGLALSYRPHARVDLGVSAQMGFGGLAPAAIIVRFMVLSVGKTAEGRGASPLTQLGVFPSATICFVITLVIAYAAIVAKIFALASATYTTGFCGDMAKSGCLRIRPGLTIRANYAIAMESSSLKSVRRAATASAAAMMSRMTTENMAATPRTLHGPSIFG